MSDSQSKSVIFNEVLSYSFEGNDKENAEGKPEEKNKKIRKSLFIDTRTDRTRFDHILLKCWLYNFFCDLKNLAGRI